MDTDCSAPRWSARTYCRPPSSRQCQRKTRCFGYSWRPSIEKYRGHDAQGDWVCGGEVHVFAAPKAAVARAGGWIARGSTLRAAARARRHWLTNPGLASQATHGRELRRAKCTIEQILDVESDVEPALTVTQMSVELREPRRYQNTIV